MLVRLHGGPLNGLDRAVLDGSSALTIPFIGSPRGIRELAEENNNEKPTAFWRYALCGNRWLFTGIVSVSENDRQEPDNISGYCEVDEKGSYILEGGEVFEAQDQDITGLFYGLFKGFLCVVKPVPDAKGFGVFTVKSDELVGVIIDKGAWCPATFGDLNRAPIRARFGNRKIEHDGMLVGVRRTEKGWRWLTSAEQEYDTCEVLKALSELPF